ncbi:acetate/propionate family kinase [Luethyella okanaganae]|uniref:Acetate kinase n=1 Tax=Luethyella okanaganae TaxID=69372 RepID=A0ABW1VA78_9MICO
MSGSILVVNSGSSSFKYQLIDILTERRLASGLVERIGEELGRVIHTVSGTGEQQDETSFETPIPDHTSGFALMLNAFGEHGPSLEGNAPVAVGHRVVHGGARFHQPTIVTPAVVRDIEDLAALAPLHNPGAVQGIEAARSAFPSVPHVAVFDTAFHQTLSPAAFSYAIDAGLAERFRIRRYGFHGTSHRFVSCAAAEFLGRPVEELNQIVLHLGNGASACAVAGGRSVETSMGMTPLEGLVMGTRSGDIDPAVLFHLHRKAGLGVDELDELLNRGSGLLGMSGRGDMRDVIAAAESGDGPSGLAFEVYLHRLKHYVGAYYAQLGRLDTIVFTAGVGENNALVRAGALEGLEGLGIRIDPQRNEARSRIARVISSDDSSVTVLVVPTNEELEIARQTLACTGRKGGLRADGRPQSAESASVVPEGLPSGRLL